MTDSPFRPFETRLDRDAALRHLRAATGGADDGEIFLERRRAEALVFDDGRVKTASYDASEGFGLRAVRGEVTGYAHSSEVSEAALARAVETARLAVGAGGGRLAAGPAATNRRLYTDEDPVAGTPFPVRIETLREIDAFARALDPRVVQVTATLAASLQEVVILRPDGQELSDTRPMTRLTVSVIVEENLSVKSWLAENTVGSNEITQTFSDLPISDFASRCGIPEEQIRTVARRLAAAESVAFYEDLGIEMAPHSTLVSYLQRVIWVLLGNYGNHGGMSVHSYAAPLFNYKASGSEPTDPVTGSLVISDFFACNEIADGILSDHPERSRALLIESTNPVHSLAESEKFRQAMRAVDFSVVVDVALTEMAREASYFALFQESCSSLYPLIASYKASSISPVEKNRAS